MRFVLAVASVCVSACGALGEKGEAKEDECCQVLLCFRNPPPSLFSSLIRCLTALNEMLPDHQEETERKGGADFKTMPFGVIFCFVRWHEIMYWCENRSGFS